jgi:uncharacterized membrane protein
MKNPKFILNLVLVLLSLFFIWLDIPQPEGSGPSPYERMLEGTVTQAQNETTTAENGEEEVEQTLNIQLNEIQNEPSQNIAVKNSDTVSLDAQLYREGDAVVVQESTDPSSGEKNYTMSDFVRRPSLYWLFGLFILVVLLISQKQGLESLIGMAFSFLVLFKWVLPLLLAGYDPVLTAISGSFFIIPITFYLSHGINKKTNLAIGGTILTLLFTGLLAKFFVGASHLSGLTDDAALYLKSYTGSHLHFQGLLLAGIMISMLGVLDDITISQASVAHQLKEAKPNMRFVELYSRTMEVGKDHIASMVNTLILIYAGASLPLLMLFLSNAHSFSEVINYEFVAGEAVQTLVGSIGLILAVPLTTILASLGNTATKSPRTK